MREVYRTYLASMLLIFVIAWPIFSIGSYVYNISFCNITPYKWLVNYVAYCGDNHFGDLEHEAFYYGLFGTDRELRQADVLFIGDSHLQFAFSRPNVLPFFAARHSHFLLAGFGYAEGWQFIDEVFKRHPPSPKILVINEDGFFARPASEAARQVFNHPILSFVDAQLKGMAQQIEAMLCRACGGNGVLVRSRLTGQWNSVSFNDVNLVGAYPVAPAPSPSQANMSAWLDVAVPQARVLIADASAKCVVLTDAPNNGPVGAFARALAARLGVMTILPDFAGLRTLDGGHLDAQSAITWSDAFLKELDRIAPQCGAW